MKPGICEVSGSRGEPGGPAAPNSGSHRLQKLEQFSLGASMSKSLGDFGQSPAGGRKFCKKKSGVLSIDSNMNVSK